MKKIAFAAAAIAATVATPAFAQDAKPMTIYVGPIVGWDHVRLSDGTSSTNDDGVLYGVVAGVDYTVGEGGLFVGIEGELSGSSVSENASDVLVAGDSAKIDAGRNLYAGVRLGTAVGAKSRVYLKGGYSNARFNGTYTDGNTTTNAGHDDLDGWVLGAGVETRLSPVMLRLEYRYSDYGSVTVNGLDLGASAKRHQIVAGVLYEF